MENGLDGWNGFKRIRLFLNPIRLTPFHPFNPFSIASSGKNRFRGANYQNESLTKTSKNSRFLLVENRGRSFSFRLRLPMRRAGPVMTPKTNKKLRFLPI